MKTLRSLMAGISMLVALITAPVTALAAVDSMPPTTSASLLGTKGGDGWYLTAVSVTLTAADGADGSGVAKIEYSLDNVIWQAYAAPLIFDQDGSQYVYFRATDVAGNVEAPAKSQEIKINKNGLVGMWHMDNNWLDSSLAHNDGIVYNGANFSSNAKIGSNAGTFDGVDDYVRIANSPSLNPKNQITVAAWYNPRSFSGSGSDSIVDKGYASHTTPYYQYHLGVSGNQNLNNPAAFSFTVAVGGVPRSAGTAPNSWIPGNWYYLVGTYDGATVKLYINGILAKSTPATGMLSDYGKDVHIGRFSNINSFLPGLIDEVRIYNRALSDTEILEHYRNYAVISPTVNQVVSPTTTASITLSGTKPANTAIMINGNTLVPLDGTTSWRTGYTLSQGLNTISITARDSQNITSLPVTLTVILDVTPPVAPTIDPISLPINTFSKTVTGTKSSDSNSIAVSCPGATIGTIFYPSATTWRVDVSGLQEGSNTIAVFAVDAAGNPSITTTAAIIVDTNPAAVGVTPAGGIYNSIQNVALAASELAVIYYTLDGSTPTTNAATYSQPIVISTVATLKYFAKDLAGNDSEIKTENYVVDMAPPLLAVSTLSDGAYTSNEILNIAGTVTDNTGVTGIAVNDTAVQVTTDGSYSYAMLLKKGINIITITATDSAGNMSTDARAVILDQTAPVLAVTSPADNSKTGKMLLEVSGTVDETSTVMVKIKDNVQSALMNDGAFSATVILEPGYNTIEITATDLAGNRSTLKRTVVLDEQVPALAITAPSQDIRTNQRNLTITGTVSDDLTAVGVTITKDNEIFTPPVINGTFEQLVDLVEEKTYGFVVTATNEVGTSTSVQRNIIYDITPPVLSIDPVLTPTSQPSLSVSGKREAGTGVTVTCATATVGEVSYPTATTWQVDVAGLSEGENVIKAASADAAGNVITAMATVVLATRPPQITITATPDVIWPPNHKMVPVTIGGGVEAYGSEIKSVSISVSDEYGKFKYNNLTFGSTVMLEAWRNGNDPDGRKYTITVAVTNKGGITTSKQTTVTVPKSY